MNILFYGLEYVRIYIDDLLIISKKSFEDHINKLDKILSKLIQKGFKVNTEKPCFARNELEYPEFRNTRKGMISLSDKVEAIENIAIPTIKKQLRGLLD